MCTAVISLKCELSELLRDSLLYVNTSLLGPDYTL